jgi:hypothetical protein
MSATEYFTADKTYMSTFTPGLHVICNGPAKKPSLRQQAWKHFSSEPEHNTSTVVRNFQYRAENVNISAMYNQINQNYYLKHSINNLTAESTAKFSVNGKHTDQNQHIPTP